MTYTERTIYTIEATPEARKFLENIKAFYYNAVIVENGDTISLIMDVERDTKDSVFWGY